MIEIKNLCKQFDDKIALKDINLTIYDGDIFGIIGLSGAGKSTLVRCINLLEKPTEGNVIIDGLDMTSLSQAELFRTRRNIGMIFQNFNLFEQRSLLKNVCYPLEIAGVPREESRKRAAEMLELVGLGDRLNDYPSILSGGQKQRVAIARALATNPKYLLCDEATSALDPTTTTSILELLKKINKEFGITIVVITHEMRVIESICNRVAVIDQSNIVEQGYVKDVFLSPKTKIAKQLVFPGRERISTELGERTVRLVFDGNSTYEPIISGLAIECRAAVSILAADIKNIDGKTYGQIVIQLPADSDADERIFEYLSNHGVSYEEVSEND